MKLWYRRDGRYFAAWISTNLFNELEVVTAWGSTYSRAGGTKALPAATESAAITIVEQISKRRRQHRYVERENQ